MAGALLGEESSIMTQWDIQRNYHLVSETIPCFKQILFQGLNSISQLQILKLE